jgi:putative transposase
MANSYTQIHIQIVFVVKYRKFMIQNDWKNELYKYMTTIIQKHGHKMLAINGIPDHIHILIGMRPTQSISELMKELKQSSSKWINENKFTAKRFQWQEGYAAFSYSKKQVKYVINYILNQENHHYKKTFKEEHVELLHEFEVDYDVRYLFHDPLE